MKFPSLRVKGKYFVVKIHGKEHYLGKKRSEAERQYKILMSEYLTDKNPSDAEQREITLRTVALSWMKENLKYLCPGSQADTKLALNEFIATVGDIPVCELKPRHVIQFQKMLAEKHLARNTIKKKLTVVKQCVRFAAQSELVPPEIWYGVNCVQNLRPGHSQAKEPRKRKPADLSHVEKILPFLRPVQRDMVWVQILSGMRPGEVCRLKIQDIQQSGSLQEREGVWLILLNNHKTIKTTGEPLVKYAGKRCQEILAPYLTGRAPEEYVFSPAISERQRRESIRKHPKKESSTPPKKKPGDHYLASTYYHVIRDACDKAGVPRFCPYSLRHTAGTEARKLSGLDGAQAFLGHAHRQTTEIYAERVDEKGIEAAKQMDSILLDKDA